MECCLAHTLREQGRTELIGLQGHAKLA
jgi:hypothetical protein